MSFCTIALGALGTEDKENWSSFIWMDWLIVQIRYYKYKVISSVMPFKMLNDVVLSILLDSKNKILTIGIKKYHLVDKL